MYADARCILLRWSQLVPPQDISRHGATSCATSCAHALAHCCCLLTISCILSQNLLVSCTLSFGYHTPITSNTWILHLQGCVVAGHLILSRIFFPGKARNVERNLLTRKNIRTCYERTKETAEKHCHCPRLGQGWAGDLLIIPGGSHSLWLHCLIPRDCWNYNLPSHRKLWSGESLKS